MAHITVEPTDRYENHVFSEMSIHCNFPVTPPNQRKSRSVFDFFTEEESFSREYLKVFKNCKMTSCLITGLERH